MYTTQSKMISRAIWVEKKHVWKINLQKNGVRKSFYSSVPGDKGRKICAQNATSWLSGACPFSVSERTTVDTVFERYLQDKALETTNIQEICNEVRLFFIVHPCELSRIISTGSEQARYILSVVILLYVSSIRKGR